jgi:hypothetical protein
MLGYGRAAMPCALRWVLAAAFFPSLPAQQGVLFY